MKGFEIKLNRQIITIGVNNGLAAIMIHNDEGGLSIFGSDNDTGENLDWGRHPLNAGDVIYITACDIGKNASSFRSTKMDRKNLVTQYYHLKKQLEDLGVL